MSKSADDLKARIRELESELQSKDDELSYTRQELAKFNVITEKLIADFNQELKLLNQLQKALSPTEIPLIPGVEFSSKFNPGTRAGGDYFDIFEHEDKMKFGILVSSASGYAMSALFLTVLIKVAAQIEAKKGLAVDAVLQLLAREIVPNISKEDEISLFYAVVDRRTFEMSYSSVGGIHAALQAYGSEQVQKLEPSTPAMSRNYNQKPLRETISLSARDRLVVATAGVGSFEEMAQATIRAPRSGVHELRNEILFQAEKRTEKMIPERDQTVIVTEVKDRVIKLAKEKR